MVSTLPVSILLLTASVLCGCAWGKAVSSLELSDESVSQAESPDWPSKICVYKGKVFTIDVRKVARRIK